MAMATVGPIMVTVAIMCHGPIMSVGRQLAVCLMMLMPGHVLVRTLHRQIWNDSSKRRRHGGEQIGNGDQPPPPSSPWPAQPAHPATDPLSHDI